MYSPEVIFLAGITYSSRPVTKRHCKCILSRTTAYKVQRRTSNEAITGQGESLSRKGAFRKFRTVRAHKRPWKKNNLRTYYVVQSGGYFSARYNLFIPACPKFPDNLLILDSFLYCTDVIRLIAEPPRTERPQTSFAVCANQKIRRSV